MLPALIAPIILEEIVPFLLGQAAERAFGAEDQFAPLLDALKAIQSDTDQIARTLENPNSVKANELAKDAWNAMLCGSTSGNQQFFMDAVEESEKSIGIRRFSPTPYLIAAISSLALGDSDKAAIMLQSCVTYAEMEQSEVGLTASLLGAYLFELNSPNAAQEMLTRGVSLSENRCLEIVLAQLDRDPSDSTLLEHSISLWWDADDESRRVLRRSKLPLPMASYLETLDAAERLAMDDRMDVRRSYAAICDLLKNADLGRRAKRHIGSITGIKVSWWDVVVDALEKHGGPERVRIVKPQSLHSSLIEEIDTTLDCVHRIEQSATIVRDSLLSDSTNLLEESEIIKLQSEKQAGLDLLAEVLNLSRSIHFSRAKASIDAYRSLVRTPSGKPLLKPIGEMPVVRPALDADVPWISLPAWTQEAITTSREKTIGSFPISGERHEGNLEA